MEELLKQLVKKVDKIDELAKKVDKIDELAKKVDKIDDLAVKIDGLEENMNQKFAQVDKRFEQVDKRFEQVDKRFEQVDKRFNNIEESLEVIREQTGRNAEISTKIELSKNREFKLLDKKVDFFVSKVSELEFKVEELSGGQK